MGSREHALCLLTNNIKKYSQWFSGEDNSIADSLSRDHQITDFEITSLLHHFTSSQIPPNLKMFPLPQEIVSWICSWLQKMPEKMLSQEIQQRSKIVHGIDGKKFLSLLKSKTKSSLSNSLQIREYEFLEPLYTQSD